MYKVWDRKGIWNYQLSKMKINFLMTKNEIWHGKDHSQVFQGIDSLSRNWIAVIERGAVDESEI